MMELLDRLKTRRRTADDDARTVFRNTWGEYGTVLARADEPQQGDDERLLELATALDRTDSEVQLDQAVLAMAIDRQAKLADEALIRQAAKESELALDAARAECATARAALAELIDESKAIGTRLSRLDALSDELTHLRVSFPELLLGKPRDEMDLHTDVPGQLHGVLPPRSLVTLARSLGIEPQPIGS